MKKVAPASNTYVAEFCSKEMYTDLLARGGTPQKSADTWMPEVPPELLPHFVRGVVDGDGTLAWNAGKPVLHIYSVSRDFLDGIAAEIDVVAGIPAPHIVAVAGRTTKSVKWSTMRAKCLVAWLYLENPGMMLARKSMIAAQFIEWQPKKRPQTGTITEKMRSRYAKYLPAV